MTKQNYVPVTLDQFLNESKTITLKRGYGEKKPVVVGSNAPTRNQILAYVAENQRVSKGDLKTFIATLNEDSRNPNASAIMWLKRNEQFFVTESTKEGTFYKLSNIGKRLSDRFIGSELSEKEEPKSNKKGDFDFVDTKKGYPRKGITDEKNEKEPEEKDKKDESCSESVSETRKTRIESIIERIKAKRASAINEGEEEKKDDEADELSFDDLDLGDEEGGDKTDGNPEEKTDDKTDDKSEDKSEEGDGEKVEITEFVITVTNADEAIKELDELGVPAEKVEEEESTEKEESKEDDKIDEAEEPKEGDDLETGDKKEGDDLELGDKKEETPEKEEKIKVSVDYWEPLKKWLEEKGVDVEEMFGGEIEIEDETEEKSDDETSGDETSGDDDLNLDLDGGEEGSEGGDDDFSLDLEEGSEGGDPEILQNTEQTLADKIADKVADKLVGKM